MRAGLIAGLILASTLSTVDPMSSSNGPAEAATPRRDIVSTAWLASRLDDPNLVVLHVGPTAGYASAHIPGARLVRQPDFAVDVGGRSLELPPAAELRQKLQALGISDRSRVVVYFAADWVSPATRILFTLQSAGLGGRVSLLDGGMRKWTEEGRAVTDRTPEPVRAGALSPFRLQPTVVDAAFVRANARRGYALIDARAPVYYGGVEAGGPRGHERRGHIPGAQNVPYTSATNPDLTLKSTEQLQALFRQAGVRPGGRAIIYCHIGQQGTVILLAARAAGIDAVLYDGSFEDWALRDLPVET